MECEPENQSKRQRIEDLENSVKLLQKLQEDNLSLLRDNHAYRDQYNDAIQLLESDLKTQELTHIQVNRIVLKLTEQVNDKVLDMERQQLEMFVFQHNLLFLCTCNHYIA